MNSGTKSAPPALAVESDQSVTDHFGMWTFLATEVLFFGGMFLAYALFRWTYPGIFRRGAQTMEFGLGTINTAVLLTSSLFMAIADRAVRADNRRLLSLCLAATAILGAVFLGIKAYEYHSKFVQHLIPGAGFHPRGGGDPRLQIFFFLYFAMTGLHAAHMVAGLLAVGWLIRLHARGRLSSAQPEPVAMVGLYWHFVDCIWVFLYPLFYLAGR
jgi:cytochrome c oxidase subunit III